MNFTHEELKEIHLALTEGRWLNQNIKDSAIKKVESYIMLSKPNTSKADDLSSAPTLALAFPSSS